MNSKITILFCAALLLISGCRPENKSVVKNAGALKSETRALSGFRRINAGNTVNLEVSAEKDFGVTIEAGENILKEITTEVRDETLIISTKDIKIPDAKINVKISLPELKKLELWGSTTAFVSNVKGDLLEIQVAGTSNLTIDGEVKSAQISSVGASTVDAADLKTEKAEVKTTGSSNITVFASNELIAESLGASNVFYLGEPKNIKQNIIGAGTIRKK